LPEFVEDSEAAISRGDLCAAYDIAARGLAADGGPERLKYLQVLALARMGATAEAQRAYQDHGLALSGQIDCAALNARLLKDRAFALPTGNRASALSSAAASYEALYLTTRDAFPGINAASLWLLAGDEERARDIARNVAGMTSEAADYYTAVSHAEALLVCGNIDEAARAIKVAAGHAADDRGARSTTRRQLQSIVAHLGLSPDQQAALLEPLSPGAVIFYCGHMFSDLEGGQEAVLAAAIDKTLADDNVTVGFGALARGSDILIAERLLDRGGELNVVLPFRREEFIARSVDGAGVWVARFEACLAKASSVTIATELGLDDDPWTFAYGSAIAMGLARLRARHLSTEVVQLAIWDQVAGPDPTAGTGVDVAAWQNSGGTSRILTPPQTGRARKVPSSPPAVRATGRTLKALIFKDFRGFSRLPESVLPVFWDEIMGRIGAVLNRHGDTVCYRNTWGDALYAVVSNATAAAEIALDLDEALAQADYTAMGLAAEGSMRISVHFGPVFKGIDPVTGRASYYGTQVSLTARIEPVTPPGAIYVTEPFASVLASEAPEAFICGYVGQIELAKGYGTSRMYRLRRA